MIGNAPAVWPTPQADQFVAGVMGDDAPGKRGVKPNGEELVAWVERQLAPGGIWADWADRGGVNILAYSKGGLDARYAYSKSYGQGKRIFKRVAMIATPNGGSNLANWACRYAEAKVVSPIGTGIGFVPFIGPPVAGERALALLALRGWIRGNWGRCRNYRDALYTLRPTWMAGFNRDVHYPRLAGPGVIAGRRSAGVEDVFGVPTPGWLQSWTLGTPNDGVVAKASAFTGRGNPNWIRPLGPVWYLNHVQLPGSRCVVTRAVSDIYRRQTNPDHDPWRDEEGSTPPTAQQRENDCAEIGVLDVPPTADPLAADYVATGTDAGVATAQEPATLTVDPEGGDTAVVQMVATPDVIYSSRISLAPGAPGTLEQYPTPLPIGGTVHNLVLRNLSGQPTTLVVDPEGPQDVSIAVDVFVESNGVWLETTQAEPTTPGGPIAVTARMHGVPASQASAYSAVASLDGDENAPWTDMTAGSVGGDLAFTVDLPMQAGELTDYSVRVVGPQPRMGEGSLQIPSDEGSIGTATGSSLVDVSGDQQPDVLRIPLPVTTSVPGEHRIGARLVDTNEKTAAAVTAFPTLTAGSQTVNLDVPLVEALRVTEQMPFSLRDVALVREDDTGPEVLVAEREDAGSAGSWLPSALLPSEPAVLAGSGAGVSVDQDAAAEHVGFPLKLWLPHAGDWRLSADAIDPTGGLLQARTTATTLDEAGIPEGREVDVVTADAAGLAELSMRIDGNSVTHAGAGEYVLDTLYVTNDADPAESYEVPLAEVYDVSDPAAFEAVPPPTVTIASGPPATTTSTAANSSFSTDGANILECQLDVGEWSRCDSRTSHALAGLTFGQHTFQIRAENATDEVIETYTWTVEGALEVLLLDPPTEVRVPQGSSSADVSIDFQVDGSPDTVTCSYRINGGAQVSQGGCVSPFVVPDVPASGNAGAPKEGKVVVTVSAESAAGQASNSATVYVRAAPKIQAITGDYDGDGRTDPALWYGASDTSWHIHESGTGNHRIEVQFGNTDYIAVPGDYDGDNKTDVAVWNRFQGFFAMRRSTGSQTYHSGWGTSGDKPVPEDYDGDGKADLAIWTPSTGTWRVENSSTGQEWTHAGLGEPGDRAVQGDYDGDGKADIGVADGIGNWDSFDSSTGAPRPLTGFGNGTTKVLPEDYDGDGVTDYGAYYPPWGGWWVYGKPTVWGLGTIGDWAVPGDWNGDWRTEMAIRHPSNSPYAVWTIREPDGSTWTTPWGGTGGVPVTGRPVCATCTDADG
jgi:hypothetical protein